LVIDWGASLCSLVGVVVFGAFSLFTAFAGSLFQLSGLRLLTGLGMGGGIPLSIALASDLRGR
jgi:MFS family permease